MQHPDSTMYLDHTDQQLEDYIDAMIDLADFGQAAQVIADKSDSQVVAAQLAKQLTDAFQSDELYGMGFESLEEEEFFFSLVAAEYRHRLVAVEPALSSETLEPIFSGLGKALANEMLG